jgi:isopenicillin N synthase-like dioxygenase
MEIPGIDWQKCAFTEDDAGLLVENFSRLGFLLLRNHGISGQLVEEAFCIAQKFFLLDSSVKKRFLRGTLSDNNAGYVAYQMESLNTANTDKKEALNITCSPWLLPDSLSFLSRLDDFYREAFALGMHILEQLGSFLSPCGDRNVLRKYHSFQSLGVYTEKDGIVAKEKKKKKKAASTLRLLHYPPSSSSSTETDLEVLAGAHSDYGTITLLFQDSCGGLQVQHGDEWVSVPAQEQGVIVVNAGDLLEIWTGGRIPSTKHRVVATPELFNSSNGRYSIAVFIHPDDDTLVQPLFGNTEKYQSVLASDYVGGRFQVSYK